MYQITIYGRPIGEPMPQWKAEAKLESLKFVVKGLGIQRVKVS